MKSLFVTATGTDIGKTYVSALIVKKMREAGFNCGYFKPILSGYLEEANDCKFVIDIAKLEITPKDCLSYYFEEAVSPHLAAKRAGVNIDISKIKSNYFDLANSYDYMLIEGAGGITCPIIVDDDVYLMDNLIKDLEQNVIVVADGGLGTINSVLTTVEYIKNRSITIKGIILNNYDKTNFMHVDNLEMIEKMTGISVMATVGVDDKDLDISKNVLEKMFL